MTQLKYVIIGAVLGLVGYLIWGREKSPQYQIGDPPEFTSQEIARTRRAVLEGMYAFQVGEYGDSDGAGDWSPAYSAEHVERCEKLIDSFLTATQAKNVADLAALKAEIKIFVLALNALDGECSGELIETQEREELGEIVDLTVKALGYEVKGDLMEEWRTW